MEVGFPPHSYLFNSPHIISKNRIAAAESTLTTTLAKKYLM
jgi:hypothetical protein